jgi:hypothetical protein
VQHTDYYACDEKDFLRLLDQDHVPVPDPVAMIKAGYNIVCATVMPHDTDPDSDKFEEAAKQQLLARGVVKSPHDAETVETEAMVELCRRGPLKVCGRIPRS